MSISDTEPTKDNLRHRALAARDALAPASRIEMSLNASNCGKGAFSFDPGTVISGYMPIRSEIDPRPYMAHLKELGARLCLPVVIDKQTLEFRELLPDSQLVDTGFGTIGPAPGAGTLIPQIMLVPLAAFDCHGGRIGYGAGHYDRAIERAQKQGRRPQLVGFAFACQQFDHLPMEAHDQRLDMIITETGIVHVDPQEQI